MPGVESTDGEWAARVRDPGDFKQDSFRRITMKRDKPRIFGIVGRLKGEDKTTLQSVRFPKADGWSKESAQAWMREHPNLGKMLDADADEEEILGLEAEEITEREVEDLFLKLVTKTPDPGAKYLAALGDVEAKAVDGDEYRVDVVASSARVDRDLEVVEPEGMLVLSKRIPLVSSHNYRDLLHQIGEVPVKSIKAEGRKVVAQPRYLVGKGNAEADWAWALVEEKLAAYSIGFRPRKYVDADLNNEDELAAVRAGKKPLRRHTEWELVELSHVVVPSQRDAVQRMVEKGVLGEPEAEVVADVLLGKRPDQVFEVDAERFDAALDRWAKMREGPKSPPPDPKPPVPPAPPPDDVLGIFPAEARAAERGAPPKITAEIPLAQYAEVGVEAFRVLGEDGVELFAGSLAELKVRLAAPGEARTLVEHTHNVNVSVEAGQVEATLEKFLEKLTSDLKEALALIPTAPTIAADSAAHLNFRRLADQIVETARSVALAEIAKEKGNVDLWKLR